MLALARKLMVFMWKNPRGDFAFSSDCILVLIVMIQIMYYVQNGQLTIHTDAQPGRYEPALCTYTTHIAWCLLIVKIHKPTRV
jgi:hypothetical protein